jgi:hypothetical protein
VYCSFECVDSIWRQPSLPRRHNKTFEGLSVGAPKAALTLPRPKREIREHACFREILLHPLRGCRSPSILLYCTLSITFFLLQFSSSRLCCDPIIIIIIIIIINTTATSLTQQTIASAVIPSSSSLTQQQQALHTTNNK